jgi:hypothetical protein
LPWKKKEESTSSDNDFSGFQEKVKTVKDGLEGESF